KFTCDGAHRLRAARELGWDQVYEIFHPEISTEEQARLFNYKRDAERGDVDPFKLAASFKWFVDQGLKQDQIARKFGVDKSTGSHRLSLLKIEEPVRTGLSELPVSHLEALTSAPAPVQLAVLAEIKDQQKRKWEITSRQVEEDVRDATREYQKGQ